MMSSHEIVFVLLTYLWGSIPFGYIITKFSTGKNILELGSGNIGSTNVGRIAGKKMSIITQILDMLIKYVSLGSIVLGISLPIIELIFHQFTPAFYYLLICSTLIILMHRKNINRLLLKKEMLSSIIN